MTLTELNNMHHQQAFDWFMQTCTATKWCEQMSQQRPFATIDQLTQCATKVWANMQESDVLEAFAGHPMIGDISTLRAKYANTKKLASNEQSGVNAATDSVLLALKQANETYLANNGFIFIICASGLSAQAMLDALQIRLQNKRSTELAIAAQEQMKITLLRINKALEPSKS